MQVAFTNFIVGGAIESYDSLEKTEQLIIELFSIAPHRMDIGTNFLSPYPGTDIRENPDSYEIKINDREMIKGPSDEYIFIVCFRVRITFPNFPIHTSTIYTLMPIHKYTNIPIYKSTIGRISDFEKTESEYCQIPF